MCVCAVHGCRFSLRIQYFPHIFSFVMHAFTARRVCYTHDGIHSPYYIYIYLYAVLNEPFCVCIESFVFNPPPHTGTFTTSSPPKCVLQRARIENASSPARARASHAAAANNGNKFLKFPRLVTGARVNIILYS